MGLFSLVYPATSASGWTLLTATYNGNGANETLTVYANGVQIGTQELTDVTKPGGTQTTFRIRPTGGTGAGAPASWDNFVTIGTFNWSDFPEFSGTDGYGNTSATAASRSGYMSNGITGSIDDIKSFQYSSCSSSGYSALYPWCFR